MKTKIIFLLSIFVMILGFESFAQKGKPIREYNERGYTNNEVYEFSVSTSTLSVNYRTEMLRRINKGLYESGQYLEMGQDYPVTEHNLKSILIDYVYYERIVLKNFINSRKVAGDKIEFYLDSYFDGTVGIFQYGKCKIILYKTICMNLLDVPTEVIIENKLPAPTAQAPASTTCCGNTYNYYYGAQPQPQQQQATNTGYYIGPQYVEGYTGGPGYALGGGWNSGYRTGGGNCGTLGCQQSYPQNSYGNVHYGPREVHTGTNASSNYGTGSGTRFDSGNGTGSGTRGGTSGSGSGSGVRH